MGPIGSGGLGGDGGMGTLIGPLIGPMMGGSLAPAPGAPAVAPGTNQQGLVIKLP